MITAIPFLRTLDCRRRVGRARAASSLASSLAHRMGDVALILLGDVMLGRIVNESLALPGQREAVWGDFQPLLQGGICTTPEEACLVTGNLECAVTRETEKAVKEFNFALHPDNIGALRSLNVSFVSLANNHSLDFLEPGLEETVAVLQQQGIAFAGVGLQREAEQPVVLSCGGLKLAFLSYSDHPVQWAATQQRKGINFIDPDSFDHRRVRAQLDAAKAQGTDLVVVFVHWGPNWQWKPSKAIQKLGHCFIESGADLVFGHSSHHIQGIEVYLGRPIIYGAGGWIDDYRLHDDFRNDLGFLYCCHIRQGLPHSLELIPSKISHTWQPQGARPPYISSVSHAQGSDQKWLERTVRRLCADFRTSVKSSERGLVIPLVEY